MSHKSHSKLIQHHRSSMQLMQRTQLTQQREMQQTLKTNNKCTQKGKKQSMLIRKTSQCMQKSMKPLKVSENV